MNKLKVITYNIDGLPDKLDLSTLPWVLKPISYIYKAIKKTTIVKINDNTDTSDKIKKISKYLAESGADLIGVQEDFNYHNELVSELSGKYSWGERSDKFSLDNLFSKIECWSHFPLPRFKSDGINLFTNHNTTMLLGEKIESWKKSNGYISHANDVLTHKGFRFYNVDYKDIMLDVYVLHMDADFYDPQNCPDVSKDIAARKSQIDQLLSFIFERFDKGEKNPIIVMGDTNSYDKYTWDVENIQYFIKNINYIPGLECMEAIPVGETDCDRIFYINLSKSKYTLDVTKCYLDNNCRGLSDHRPLVAEFLLTHK